MFLRVVLITLFLGSSLFLDPTAELSRVHPERAWLFWLILGTYGLTISYALVYRRLVRGHEAFAGVQLAVDLLVSAVAVALTGGTESVFMFLNTLVILSGAVVLGRRAALYLLVPATGLILLAVARDALGWLRPEGPVSDAELFSVYLSAITHLSAMFLVALLAGYLSEQLQATGQELRFASADLKTLRALNDRIIQDIKSGILSHDLQGRVMLVNPAAARMLGVSPEEARQHTLSELVPDRPAGSPDRWEARVVRDGHSRVLGLTRSPMLDGQGQQTGWIVVFQDLTQVRELEQSLRRSERLAAIGELAAGLAHELRNPLAGISGSVQMLQQANLEPLQQRLLGIVLREIDRLDALIADFLRFARPTPPQPLQLDLHPLVAEVLEVFTRRSDVPEVRLINTVPTDLRLTVDPGQLRQVLLNLVLNAAQASQPGGRIEVSAHVDESDPSLICLQVRDEGAGMAPDVQARIFNPFFTTRPEGTGLGLAQVHRIVEDHGGSLGVLSQPGEGSTFTLRLPALGPGALPAETEEG